jgi:hypothetical protein
LTTVSHNVHYTHFKSGFKDSTFGFITCSTPYDFSIF